MAAARKKGGPRGAVKKARTLVRDALGAAQDTVQARVGNARDQAGETWDALESLFRSRVRKVLAELGVPAGDEVRQLARRVAELGDAVQALSGKSRVAAKRKPRVATERKSRRAAR
jgi:poly(hydroxyalkanoate) granule-associated protein